MIIGPIQSIPKKAFRSMPVTRTSKRQPSKIRTLLAYFLDQISSVSHPGQGIAFGITPNRHSLLNSFHRTFRPQDGHAYLDRIFFFFMQFTLRLWTSQSFRVLLYIHRGMICKQQRNCQLGIQLQLRVVPVFETRSFSDL